MRKIVNGSNVGGFKNASEYEDLDYDGILDGSETDPALRDTDNDGVVKPPVLIKIISLS